MHPELENFWRNNGARFTELLVVGGSSPQSYGFISYGTGIYGRSGLEQDEFFESIRLIAYVDGMIAILGDAADLWLSAQIKAEIARVEALR